MNRNTRIILGLLFALIIVGKIWNITQHQRAAVKKSDMRFDLYHQHQQQQLKERIESQKEMVIDIPTIDLDSLTQQLEETRKGLEEIGKELEKMSD